MEISINSSEGTTLGKKGNQFFIGDKQVSYEIERLNPSKIKIFLGKKIFTAEMVGRKANELILSIDGKEAHVTIKDPIDQVLHELGMNTARSSQISEIKAPMPGTILSLFSNVGDEVKKEDQVLVLEAMKMENVIKSPGEGTISKILVAEGDNVEKNELLITFE